ncbi:MAG: hypothetical protein ABI599_18415 [Flavobacteriales bacterium]
MQRLANSLVRVTGYTQEYLCIEADSMGDRFQWTIDGSSIDPRSMLFLGYRPLVVGFAEQTAVSGGWLTLEHEGEAIAGMRLAELPESSRSGIRLFTAATPWQRFLPALLDPLDRLRQRFNERRAGNVTRSMIEYDQLRIAYAQPREIHLAVVGPPERCNIFPTDLHGPLGTAGYVISLRHANAVCAHLRERGELLLCRMPLDSYKAVYRLGARHNAGWENADRIRARISVLGGHAVPDGTRSAIRLELQDHQDVGIHRLHRFAVKERAHFSDGPVLAHAHAAPLGWLKRRGLAPPVWLR